jgi:hypothetical protein
MRRGSGISRFEHVSDWSDEETRDPKAKSWELRAAMRPALA